MPSPSATFAAGWEPRPKASGVEIYPGFAVRKFSPYHVSVCGVVAGVMGISKDGTHKPDYQPGMELIGKDVFIAEDAVPLPRRSSPNTNSRKAASRKNLASA